MFECNWLRSGAIFGSLIAATILCASASDGQPNVSQPQNPASTNQTQHFSRPPSPVTVIGPIALEREKAVESDWAKPNCATPSSHDEADLCQQQRMSQASEYAVWWAKVQTLLGILGFVAVVVSLIFAGWSAIAAGRAAKAAQSSIAFGMDTAERQLRAYIGPHTYESTVYPFEAGEYAFIAHIEMRNFGLTPAYEVSGWMHAKIEVPDAMSFGNMNDPSEKKPGFVAFPQSGFHFNVGWPISTEEKEALRKQEKRFFIWGRVRYMDAFREPHHFTFRMMSGKIATGTSGVFELGPHELGYEAD